MITTHMHLKEVCMLLFVRSGYHSNLHIVVYKGKQNSESNFGL